MPGGSTNTASGLLSFAAGLRAKAIHQGAFVWGDSTNADFASTGSNQFLIRAGGGVGLASGTILELGFGVAGKELNAGKIGYQTFTADALDIVGAGTTSANRKIKLWAEAGVLATGPYNNVSDGRYKENIATFPDALEAILHLRGVTFDWRHDVPDMNFSAGKQIGFIAQEVEKVLPELVSTDSNGYKSVAYANVVPVLVEAVKAQNKQVETLSKDNATVKAEVTNLKADNAELKAKNAELEARLERLEAVLNNRK